jgi:hypothetical protein
MLARFLPSLVLGPVLLSEFALLMEALSSAVSVMGGSARKGVAGSEVDPLK